MCASVMQAGMMHGVGHDCSISEGTDGIQTQWKETRYCCCLLAESDALEQKEEEQRMVLKGKMRGVLR